MGVRLNKDLYSDVSELIEDFNWKIKQSLNNTSYQDREDLEQEIKLKIIEKIYTVEFNDPPTLWDFIS
ncbi:hypothetical protein JUJ52_03225 [Virgibacillus sp. AGTR]|uniref:hypothetical protein n=1 Tax=Virgibacillus sp. AGTR TaxID=2812055 RepID=UPI001D16D7DE|nr:hypothetical protein [Virgibacillus sp. AGTR]MCC2248969.1 hypothetical protein [Virgibacillus sp. AGTR]